jgi:hypothetical protein
VAESCLGRDDERVSDIASRQVELALLSPDLSPQVMAWAKELRALFIPLGMSISLFSRLHPIDKGTVSRYLNGKRVPADRWFLDKVLTLRTTAGIPVTDEVRTHLVDLQEAALKVAHPHEYRVRKISDELEVAVTRWKEAERFAQSLEQELTELTQTLQDLLAEKDLVRTAWDEDRRRYHQEITELTRQLKLARNRARRAERRVKALEEVLNQLESQQTATGSFSTDISSNDPRAAAGLLDGLRRAGADAQIALLVERIPVDRLNLNDTYAVIGLLDALRRVGAGAQIALLVERIPVDSLNLNDTYAVIGLLDALGRVGADAQIAMLVQRISAVRLHSLHVTIRLLDALRRVRAHDQITALVERISDLPIDLNDAQAVADLLDGLRRVGADTQIAMLIERIPKLAVKNEYSMIRLLDALRRIRAHDQITMLVERIPDFFLDLRSAYPAIELLNALRRVRARAQIAVIAHRAARDVVLDDANALATLLRTLQRVETIDQLIHLADRIATNAPVDAPHSVTRLLTALKEVGAESHANTLAKRARGNRDLAPMSWVSQGVR